MTDCVTVIAVRCQWKPVLVPAQDAVHRMVKHNTLSRRASAQSSPLKKTRRLCQLQRAAANQPLGLFVAVSRSDWISGRRHGRLSSPAYKAGNAAVRRLLHGLFQPPRKVFRYGSCLVLVPLANR